MNILFTICGRAGSKGVRNKNIRNFRGIPLVKYTIAAAYLFKDKHSEYNVDICVNSDSDELLNMSSKYSDIVAIMRPNQLAQDDSPKVPVIAYSVKYMEKMKEKTYDYVIDLDITSPLRKLEDIENALAKAMANDDADVVFSVVHARRNPYFNMVEDKDGKMQKIIKSNFVTRQQAPKVYDMNASIYCYKRDSLMNIFKNSPFDGNFDIIIMKDTGVLDIDSEEDFDLMQILAEYFFRTDYIELYNYACRYKS